MPLVRLVALLLLPTLAQRGLVSPPLGELRKVVARRQLSRCLLRDPCGEDPLASRCFAPLPLSRRGKFPAAGIPSLLRR